MGMDQLKNAVRTSGRHSPDKLLVSAAQQILLQGQKAEKDADEEIDELLNELSALWLSLILISYNLIVKLWSLFFL